MTDIHKFRDRILGKIKSDVAEKLLTGNLGEDHPQLRILKEWAINHPLVSACEAQIEFKKKNYSAAVDRLFEISLSNDYDAAWVGAQVAHSLFLLDEIEDSHFLQFFGDLEDEAKEVFVDYCNFVEDAVRARVFSKKITPDDVYLLFLEQMVPESIMIKLAGIQLDGGRNVSELVNQIDVLCDEPTATYILEFADSSVREGQMSSHDAKKLAYRCKTKFYDCPEILELASQIYSIIGEEPFLNTEQYKTEKRTEFRAIPGGKHTRRRIVGLTSAGHGNLTLVTGGNNEIY